MSYKDLDDWDLLGVQRKYEETPRSFINAKSFSILSEEIKDDTAYIIFRPLSKSGKAGHTYKMTLVKEKDAWKVLRWAERIEP
jgi:hypothetical protein